MTKTDLGKSEDLGVEYKAWMDTSLPEVRAKLARHIAALANHGGGHLIIGVDDTTRLPQSATTLDVGPITMSWHGGLPIQVHFFTSNSCLRSTAPTMSSLTRADNAK